MMRKNISNSKYKGHPNKHTLLLSCRRSPFKGYTIPWKSLHTTNRMYIPPRSNISQACSVNLKPDLVNIFVYFFTPFPNVTNTRPYKGRSDTIAFYLFGDFVKITKKIFYMFGYKDNPVRGFVSTQRWRWFRRGLN